MRSRRVRKISKTLRLVFIVLLVPIVPFAVLGWWFEPLVERFSQTLSATLSSALVLIALLASDILLPIPSSVVCTFAGRQFGVTGGAICSFLGLTLGSLAGFAAARRWGRPLAERYADDESLSQMDAWQSRHSTWALVISRPLPVLSEAAVLLAGVNQVSWRRFLPPVLLSNAALAISYSALGEYAAENRWFPTAAVLAAALPLFMSELARRRWTREP